MSERREGRPVKRPGAERESLIVTTWRHNVRQAYYRPGGPRPVMAGQEQ
jgi:hypothetical protein